MASPFLSQNMTKPFLKKEEIRAVVKKGNDYRMNKTRLKTRTPCGITLLGDMLNDPDLMWDSLPGVHSDNAPFF